MPSVSQRTPKFLPSSTSAMKGPRKLAEISSQTTTKAETGRHTMNAHSAMSTCQNGAAATAGKTTISAPHAIGTFQTIPTAIGRTTTTAACALITSQMKGPKVLAKESGKTSIGA